MRGRRRAGRLKQPSKPCMRRATCAVSMSWVEPMALASASAASHVSGSSRHAQHENITARHKQCRAILLVRMLY